MDTSDYHYKKIKLVSILLLLALVLFIPSLSYADTIFFKNFNYTLDVVSYISPDTAYIEVVDTSANVSPLIDTVPLTVSGTGAISDTENLIANEIDTNNVKFRVSLPISNNIIDSPVNSGKIYAFEGYTLTAIYGAGNDTVSITSGGGSPSPKPVIEFRDSSYVMKIFSYNSPETAYIEVCDSNANTTGGVDSIQVTVKNVTVPETEILAAFEVDADDSRFHVSLWISDNPADSITNGKLYALCGHTINATYDETYTIGMTIGSPPPNGSVPPTETGIYDTFIYVILGVDSSSFKLELASVDTFKLDFKMNVPNCTWSIKLDLKDTGNYVEVKEISQGSMNTTDTTKLKGNSFSKGKDYAFEIIVTDSMSAELDENDWNNNVAESPTLTFTYKNTDISPAKFAFFWLDEGDSKWYDIKDPANGITTQNYVFTDETVSIKVNHFTHFFPGEGNVDTVTVILADTIASETVAGGETGVAVLFVNIFADTWNGDTITFFAIQNLGNMDTNDIEFMGVYHSSDTILDGTDTFVNSLAYIPAYDRWENNSISYFINLSDNNPCETFIVVISLYDTAGGGDTFQAFMEANKGVKTTDEETGPSTSVTNPGIITVAFKVELIAPGDNSDTWDTTPTFVFDFAQNGGADSFILEVLNKSGNIVYTETFAAINLTQEPAGTDTRYYATIGAEQPGGFLPYGCFTWRVTPGTADGLVDTTGRGETSAFFYVSLGGLLTQDVTLLTNNGPFLVSGDANIGEGDVGVIFQGCTLTIDAGCIIGFDTDINQPTVPTLVVVNNGGLRAIGTDSNNIIFTSSNDTPFKSPSAQAGDWGSIVIENVDSVVLRNVIIRYGGGYFEQEAGINRWYPVLTIEDSDVLCETLSIINSKSGSSNIPSFGLSIEGSGIYRKITIDSSYFGIIIQSSENKPLSEPTLTDITISGVNVPLVYSGNAFPIYSGSNTFDGTSYDAVFVNSAETITISGTWNNPGVPLLINPPGYPGNLIKDKDGTDTMGYGLVLSGNLMLEIAQGCKIAFYTKTGSADSSCIASLDSAIIRAIGTASDTIYFTSHKDPILAGYTGFGGGAGMGYWGGIYVYNKDNADTLKFEYCDFNYGAYVDMSAGGQGEPPGIAAIFRIEDTSTLHLKNTYLNNCYAYGIEWEGEDVSTLRLENSRIENNIMQAVEVRDVKDVYIDGCQIIANGITYATGMDTRPGEAVRISYENQGVACNPYINNTTLNAIQGYPLCISNNVFPQFGSGNTLTGDTAAIRLSGSYITASGTYTWSSADVPYVIAQERDWWDSIYIFNYDDSAIQVIGRGLNVGNNAIITFYNNLGAVTCKIAFEDNLDTMPLNMV
ncbi:MAG: hypothetical protein AB1765_09820, partial [Candidatus Hydrogenedentota bacterium]